MRNDDYRVFGAIWLANRSSKPIKTVAEFIKTTLIGGVLIILPIYLAVLLLAKMVNGLLALLAPVTAQIPAVVEFRLIVAIILLLMICFVVGLILRTGPGLRVKDAFERAVLQKLPGYTFLRGLAKRLTGGSEEPLWNRHWSRSRMHSFRP